MLKEMLELGFFEIKTGEDSKVRTFRLYEKYKEVQLRILVSLQNDVFEVEHIFFYSPNSDKLKLELFGNDITVANVISKIKDLHKLSKPFNKNPETG
ncbi:hypothetical protein [Taibaiella helva]|uniref:hypothetical protein n=1 Tax=Taibaiella helva TaxID=2301235 RepID=UPI000E599009|nr:hypothetical protein [Taibaiella helva]